MSIDLSSTSAAVPRRQFLKGTSASLVSTALALLLERDGLGTPASPAVDRPPADLASRTPHFAARAKAVIHLFMNGGPSQMDLFDPKPELERFHGQPYFNKIAGEVENPQQAGALMRSPFAFRRCGQSGMWISDALPALRDCADDITLIRSMFTENITHEPSLYRIHGGQMLPGRPALGSWITYGLGSENQNLPAYVVLDDPRGLPINGTQNWQSGFLPPVYQGTRFRATDTPVVNLKRQFDEPDAVTRLERRLIRELDQWHRDRRPHQPRLDARIASYELAGRMQLAASEALDLSSETPQTLRMYGVDQKPTDSYVRRCLLARRLVERGVRFVQLFIDGQIWDNHNNLKSTLKEACDRTDKPIAALLKDLKQRGLLDQTLVVWGGEFGRLPIAQLGPDKDASKSGRDHNKNAMCTWMAGGGLRGGLTYGTTDELGFAAAEQTVSVADWHATMLAALGLDYHKLFYLRNGLQERLTGVEEPRVIEELFQ